jgi:uncharacterized protein (TIGR03435 family)
MLMSRSGLRFVRRIWLVWLMCVVTSPVVSILKPAAGCAQTLKPGQAPPAHSSIKFAVAAVKINTSQRDPTFVPEDGKAGGNDRTGGYFSATNQPLSSYIEFAYPAFKTGSILKQLPDWTRGRSYDIQARADGNPTKDEMRLMMQSLLADRFSLVVHLETQQAPVYAIQLAKPGALGPHLRPHKLNPPCAGTSIGGGSADLYAAVVPGGFPISCGDYADLRPMVPGDSRRGARDISMGSFADDISEWEVLDRPVVDQTGLSGTFDYVLEFMHEARGAGSPGPPPAPGSARADGMGTIFEVALRQQLGLKVVKSSAPVKRFVIDRVLAPSAN